MSTRLPDASDHSNVGESPSAVADLRAAIACIDKAGACNADSECQHEEVGKELESALGKIRAALATLGAS